MQLTFASVVLATVAAVSAQGVPAGIAPASAPPAGCSTTYNGNFEITVVLPAKKRSIERRDTCGGSGTFVGTLKGGILTDAVGRIGSIVANRQFQFDGPPAQTGAIYTGGWSICPNSSLAIGGTTVFYQCQSGTFYNLYDQNTSPQCSEVEIDIIPCTVATGGATQATDGQVQASSAVSQITDGQVQASSAVTKVTQISDGQIQVTSAGPKVTQISDGQIQVTSAGPKVTQIPDGQIQVSSAGPRPPVSQYTDGQLQVTAMPTVTAKPVSQYTDGQIQVPITTAKPVVSQISDGQIQVPTTIVTKPVVSQISDGQIQAPNATASTTKPVAAGAARMTFGASVAAAVVALGAFAML